MKRLVLIGLAVTVATLLQVGRSVADDESRDIEVRLRAPLEETDCAATPPTIKVLGLTIDVGTAAVEADPAALPTPIPSPTAGPGEVDDGGQGRHRQGGTNDPLPNGCYYCAMATPTPAGGCASLVVGDPVEVKLVDDGVPLTAAQVKQDASGDPVVQIKAPIQSLDRDAGTITLLGLPIDISAANLEGADDDSENGSTEGIEFDQLMVGQFVEARPLSNVAPLAADELEVKNFANQVEAQLDDVSGKEDEIDANGNPIPDVDVDVVEAVFVPPVSGASAGSRSTRHGHALLHFHTYGTSSLSLAGLPTGVARITATRVVDDVVFTGRRTVRVKGNRVRPARIRLRPQRP